MVAILLAVLFYANFLCASDFLRLSNELHFERLIKFRVQIEFWCIEQICVQSIVTKYLSKNVSNPWITIQKLLRFKSITEKK